jgi:hypothetical protein
MSYADERVRPLLDMEGLKQWMPWRTSGYAQLRAAVERFGTIDQFVRTLAAPRRKWIPYQHISGLTQSSRRS